MQRWQKIKNAENEQKAKNEKDAKSTKNSTNENGIQWKECKKHKRFN